MSTYAFKRLILVNSAIFCYGEFPLDRHTLLTATGNSGKSSVLNALKFFWLPETNFKRAEKKFKFVDRQSDSGFYSGNDTYSYYFPTEQSYLILEVENAHGPYCQILYGRPGMSYGRLMVPGRYEEIEHLFWQKNTGDLGLGAPNKSLSLAYVKKELKALSPSMEDVTQGARLNECLYSDSMLDDDAKFSLFPLRKNEQADLDTLRTMIHALCGFKAGSGDLAALFANIIETGKKEESDILELNLNHLLEEREYICQQERDLTKLESHQGLANGIAELKCQLVELKDTLGGAYIAADKGLDGKLADAKGKVAEFGEKVVKLSTQIKAARAELRIVNDELVGEKRLLTKANKVITEYKKTLETGKKAVSDYFNMSEDEIVDILRDEIKECEEQLASLDDDAKRSWRKRTLLEGKARLEKRIPELKSVINDKEKLLCKQLSPGVFSVLVSLSGKFKSAQSDYYSQDDLQVIEKFAGLFDRAGDTYTLYGASFDVSNATVSDKELLNELKSHENELSDVLNELEHFKQFEEGDAAKKDRLVEQKRQEIVKLQLQVKTINSMVFSEAKMKEEISEAEALKESIEALTVRHDSIKKRLSELDEAHGRAKVCKQQIEDDNKLWNDLKGRLKTASNNPVFKELIESIVADNISPNNSVDEEYVNRVSHSMGKYASLIGQLQDSLKAAVQFGIIDDPMNATYSSNRNFAVLLPLANSVHDKFSEIASRRENLANDKLRHKSTLSLKVQELSRNAELITDYEAKVNRHYKEVKINNLEGVRVSIKTDDRFADLVAQINHSDFHGDEEISDAFYERLATFVETFFKSGESQVLTMSNIIKSVSFSTKKADGKWSETGQSNSTVSLISITLLQKMIREIMNPDIKTKIPLIIDEIAHIDESEFPWLLRSIKSDGYNLLAASTNNMSVYALNEIGTQCSIDETYVNQSYSAGRNVYYCGFEGMIEGECSE